MQREQAIDDAVITMQQAFGTLATFFRNLRPNPKHSLEARELPHSHAKIDHDQIGIGTEIYRSSIDAYGHSYPGVLQSTGAFALAVRVQTMESPSFQSDPLAVS